MSNTQNTQSAEPIQFIRPAAAARLLGMSRGSLYCRSNPAHPQHDPAFPRKYKLGPRTVAFRLDELKLWIDGLKQVA